MTSPIDNNLMPLLSGGKGKRGEDAVGKPRDGVASASGGAAMVGDRVNISSAGSQLNAAPRMLLEDGAQAAQMAQKIKAAFAEQGALAMLAQGGQVKGDLQGLL